MQLRPERMYLSDGLLVEFPDSAGKFDMTQFVTFDTLTVHAGSSLDSQRFFTDGGTPSAGALPSTSSSSESDSLFRTPARQSWLPSSENLESKNKGKATTIDVVHASRNQDAFPGEHTAQCFLTVTEDLANVPTATRPVRDHFESSSLVLCSANGLAIPDTSATTGMSLSLHVLFQFLNSY